MCVYLDNKRINEVILADDVEGWVVIPKKDANNQLMVDDCGNLKKSPSNAEVPHHDEEQVHRRMQQ